MLAILEANLSGQVRGYEDLKVESDWGGKQKEEVSHGEESQMTQSGPSVWDNTGPTKRCEECQRVLGARLTLTILDTLGLTANQVQIARRQLEMQNWKRS